MDNPVVRKSIVWLFLVIMMSTSCVQQKSDSPEKPQELLFEIDSLRVGAFYADPIAGFQFQAPKHWQPVADQLMEKLAAQVTQPIQSQEIDFRPLTFFLNHENGSALSISRIISQTDTTWPQLRSQYIDLVKTNFQATEFKSGEFMKDEIQFTQFLIQTDKTVNFKLVFENRPGQIIQLDYIVPKNYYPNEVKAIESSIGSIKRIKS